MSSNYHDSLEIFYTKNTFNNNNVVVNGRVYTKKTNLEKAGKIACNFRCYNRKCTASVSLRTENIDGINWVKEPFEVYQCNIFGHRDDCKELTQQDIEEKEFLYSIKEAVRESSKPIQQIYNEKVQDYLGSTDSEIVKNFNTIKHILKYSRRKCRENKMYNQFKSVHYKN